MTTIGLKVLLPIGGKIDQVGNHVEFKGHLAEDHPLIAKAKQRLYEQMELLCEKEALCRK